MKLIPRFIFFIFFLHAAAFGQPSLIFKQKALDHLRKGEYPKAVENLNIAIRQEPALAELWYLRGYAKYSLEDFMGAEADYTRSIDISPYLSDVFTNRAVVRSQLQNYTGALEDFGRALEMDSTNGEIWFFRARTNLALKKHYSCIIDCNRAIRLKYPGEAAYLLRSSAEMEIKRYEQALEDLETALRINPGNGNIYSQRGLVHTDMNQPDSAINDFTKAIELDSTNVFALFNRSLAYLKFSDRVNALRDLNRVIRFSPYNSYAYYNRAIVLIGLNEKRGAIRDFEIVSKLDPRNIISYYYAGKLKAELHDYPGALEDFNKTLELLPDYTDAYYDRYELKLKMNDMKGAQADYQRAIGLAGRNHFNFDSLKAERKDYLKSLVRLSGDFEQMNTRLLQNQAVDIRLRPMFVIFLWKADFTRLRLYDVYKKDNYFTSILSFTNQAGLAGDSLLQAEILRQNRVIDSAGHPVKAIFKRAASYSLLRKYENAIADYNAALQADPEFIAAYFGRAQARFELLQLLSNRDEFQPGITIGKPLARASLSNSPGSPVHTYDTIIADLTKAILLDPGFYIAWYNRGYVNAHTGNYREALADFDRAIALNGDFAEAWYNRGLINILLNENKAGCSDLSRAGELGIPDAYRVMKRYCYK